MHHFSFPFEVILLLFFIDQTPIGIPIRRATIKTRKNLGMDASKSKYVELSPLGNTHNITINGNPITNDITNNILIHNSCSDFLVSKGLYN